MCWLLAAGRLAVRLLTAADAAIANMTQNPQNLITEECSLISAGRRLGFSAGRQFSQSTKLNEQKTGKWKHTKYGTLWFVSVFFHFGWTKIEKKNPDVHWFMRFGCIRISNTGKCQILIIEWSKLLQFEIGISTGVVFERKPIQRRDHEAHTQAKGEGSLTVV